MPSAATTLCSHCSLNASKYTCPRCSSKTCSLACSKAHTASSPCQPSKPTAATGSPSAPSQAATTTAAAATAPSSSAPSHYVPLASYTDANLYNDYVFLNAVSRSTQAIGRDIVKNHLLPPPAASTASNAAPSHAQNRANGPGEPGGRQTNAQRQKEQLRKQLYYRRLAVMLLPDGMWARKVNQTGWNPKERCMRYTAGLRFGRHADPLGKGKQSVTRAETDRCERDLKAVGVQVLPAAPNQPIEAESQSLLHRLDGSTPIEQLVLDELERKSFSRKDIKAFRSRAAPVSAGGEADKAWYLSAALLQRLGLPRPPPTLGPSSPSSSSAESLEQDPIICTSFPPTWTLLLPLHEQRLRNESTTKYLDWFNRKQEYERAAAAKEEEVAAARAAAANSKRPSGRNASRGGRQQPQPQPQSNGVVHDMQGVPTGPRSLGPSPIPATSTTEAVYQQQGGGASQPPYQAHVQAQRQASSLIPAHILSQLSALRPTVPAPASPPAPTPVASTPPAPTPTNDPPSPPSPKQASRPSSSSKPYLRLSLPHLTQGLETLLQSLPTDYAVIEFPTLDVWPSQEVDDAVASGHLALLSTNADVTKRQRNGIDATGAGEHEEQAHSEGGPRKRRRSTSPRSGLGASPTHPAAVPPAPPRALKPSLVAYPSSDSEDTSPSDSDLDANQHPAAARPAEKGATPTVPHPRLLASIYHDSPSTTTPSSPSTPVDTPDHSVETQQIGTDLASFAREAGFTVLPPSAPSRVQTQTRESEAERAVTPAGVDGEVQGPQRVYSILRAADEEEEVDFDDDG